MARDFTAASSHKIQATSLVTGFPLTMACWVYSDSLSDDTIIDICNGGSTNSHMRMYADNAPDSIKVNYIDSTGAQDTINMTGFSTGSWFHAAAAFVDTNDRKAWLDGTQFTDSSALAGVSGIDSLNIGLLEWSSDIQFFDGRVCEVAVWDAELSQADIDILAAGYSPLFVKRANLRHYLPLFGGQSPEVDWVGGQNGTVTGATQIAHPRIIYPAAPILFGSVTSVAPSGRIMGSLAGSGGLAGTGGIAGAGGGLAA